MGLISISTVLRPQVWDEQAKREEDLDELGAVGCAETRKKSRNQPRQPSNLMGLGCSDGDMTCSTDPISHT